MYRYIGTKIISIRTETYDIFNLERFAEALLIKNAAIDVTGIEKEYSSAIVGYDDFYRLVEEGEIDDSLDEYLILLKELLEVTRDGFSRVCNVFDRL